MLAVPPSVTIALAPIAIVSWTHVAPRGFHSLVSRIHAHIRTCTTSSLNRRRPFALSSRENSRLIFYFYFSLTTHLLISVPPVRDARSLGFGTLDPSGGPAGGCCREMAEAVASAGGLAMAAASTSVTPGQVSPNSRLLDLPRLALARAFGCSHSLGIGAVRR